MRLNPVSFACVHLSVCSIGFLISGCGGGPGTSPGGGGGNGGGSSPTTVTFHFSGPAPVAVAAKIGSGSYTAQSLNGPDLALNIPAGTTDFAAAYVCPPSALPGGGAPIPTVTSQWVLQQNLADGTSFFGSCDLSPANPQTGTLTGSVGAAAIAGISYLSVLAVKGSSSLATHLDGATADFAFAAPAGTDRVEVLAFGEGSPGSLPFSSSVIAAKTFDDQPVPGALNGGNPVVFGSADRTTTQPITYRNVPSGYSPPTTSVFFNMAGQTGFTVALGAGSSYPVMPAAAARTGDSYGFIATAYQNALGSRIGPGVLVQTNGLTGGPVVFSFPAPWSYNGPVPAALPAFDFSYTGFSGNTGVHRGAFLAWESGDGNPNQYTFSLSSSANYQGGTPTQAFSDLSSLPGFLSGPAPGTEVSWLADILHFESSGGATGLTAVESSGNYWVP